MKIKSSLIIGVLLIVLGISLPILAYFYSETSETGIKYTMQEIKTQEVILDNIEVVTENQSIESGTYISSVKVPSVGIDCPIVEGTSLENLRFGAGHFTDTADSGELGNYSLAGHSSSIYNCVFNNLDKISLGDEIKIYNKDGVEFTYYCITKTVIYPDNWTYLRDYNDTRVTLITCSEGGAKRLVVQGIIMSKEEISIIQNTKLSDKLADLRSLSHSYNSSLKSTLPYVSIDNSNEIILHRIPQLLKYL